MTASALLAELQRRGVTLSGEGDRLIYDAPARSLDYELRAELREHKAALLAILRAEASGEEEMPAGALPEWIWCRLYDFPGPPPPAHLSAAETQHLLAKARHEKARLMAAAARGDTVRPSHGQKEHDR